MVIILLTVLRTFEDYFGGERPFTVGVCSTAYHRKGSSVRLGVVLTLLTVLTLLNLLTLNTYL